MSMTLDAEQTEKCRKVFPRIFLSFSFSLFLKINKSLDGSIKTFAFIIMSLNIFLLLRLMNVSFLFRGFDMIFQQSRKMNILEERQWNHKSQCEQKKETKKAVLVKLLSSINFPVDRLDCFPALTTLFKSH